MAAFALLRDRYVVFTARARRLTAFAFHIHRLRDALFQFFRAGLFLLSGLGDHRHYVVRFLCRVLAFYIRIFPPVNASVGRHGDDESGVRAESGAGYDPGMAETDVRRQTFLIIP